MQRSISFPGDNKGFESIWITFVKFFPDIQVGVNEGLNL